MDRAKATVEEIELLKMSDFVRSVPISVTPISNEVKQLRRSRSKSSGMLIFLQEIKSLS